MDGSCLHFTASSAGDIFVVFATVPNQRKTWYYVHIGVSEVAIYKAEEKVKRIQDSGAVLIGDKLLHESYFICLYEKPNITLIEYGKSQRGSPNGGDVYLVYLDSEKPLKVRFYAFGNMKEVVSIWDAHIIPRDLTDAKCKGGTYKDLETGLCVNEKCHPYCDPLAGCKSAGADVLSLSPSDCLACRYGRDTKKDRCVESCPNGTKAHGEKKDCLVTFDVKYIFTRFTVVTVSNRVPILDHLTFCAWVKYPKNMPTNDLPVKYDAGGDRSVTFSLEVGYRPNLETGGSCIVGISRSSISSFSTNIFYDHEWHPFCCTWNGVTGTILAYVDGVRAPKNTQKGRYVGSVPGGGKLTFAYDFQERDLTEFNLWNRVLSSEEIAESSRSCLASTGNVVTWLDLRPDFSTQTDNSSFVSPSQCKSPAQLKRTYESRSAGNGDVPTENVDKTYKPAGKKKYHLKFKNEKGSTKNTDLEN